jgi:hypothetical protein
MQWHLDEISSQVAPGAHAVLIVDRAGWHTTGKLVIPPNITLLLLPPRSPELKPYFQILRRNPRTVLPSLEQTHRSALDNHVHRTAELGSSVLINARWYKPAVTGSKV